jgi:hypothetical protein
MTKRDSAVGGVTFLVNDRVRLLDSPIAPVVTVLEVVACEDAPWCDYGASDRFRWRDAAGYDRWAHTVEWERVDSTAL